MEMRELGVVMRALLEQVVQAMMVLLERAGVIPSRITTLRRGIFSLTGDKAGRAGRAAMPIVEPKVERAVKAATVQTALVHRAGQEMEERVVKVEGVGAEATGAGEEREAMARMVATFR